MRNRRPVRPTPNGYEYMYRVKKTRFNIPGSVHTTIVGALQSFFLQLDRENVDADVTVVDTRDRKTVFVGTLKAHIPMSDAVLPDFIPEDD